MPVPPLKDLITPTSTAVALPAQSLNERLMLTLAMLATGKAPDGTTLPTGAAVGPPVTGYAAWYDASQITGSADNTALASWPDLSGNGWTFAAAGSAQPTYYSSTSGKTINGKPAVWFNGTSNIMVTTAPIIPTASACTFITVSQVPAINADRPFFNSKDNLGGGWTGLLSNENTPGTMSMLVNAVAWTPAAGFASAPTPNLPHAYSLRWDATIAANALKATIDSAFYSATATNLGAVPAAPSYLGGGFSGTRFHNGAICEVIIYPSILTDPQITSIYTYLKTKWGTP